MNFSDLFENPEPHIRRIVKLAEDNLELYKLLYSSSMAMQRMEKVKGMLVERVMSTIDVPEIYKSSFSFEFSLRFFISGIIDIYTQWINGEMDCTFDELTEQLIQLVIRAAEPYRLSMQGA